MKAASLSLTKRIIRKDLRCLAERDRHVSDALDRFGYPEPRPRVAGLEAFLITIISQQISTQAAKTITERVFACLPEMSAESVLSVKDEVLRGAGLSQRKLEYIHGICHAILDGSFDPDAIIDMDDAEAIEHIVQLRGFGVWSAEIYLLFSLGRRNIFPADDLIIRQSLEKLKRKRKPLSSKLARAEVKHWTPYKSAGSLFLWHLHHCGFS